MRTTISLVMLFAALFCATPAQAAKTNLPRIEDPACKDAVPEKELRTTMLVARTGFRVIEGTLEKEGLGHVKAQSLGDVLVAFTTDQFGTAGHCGYYNRGLFYEISGESFTDESGVVRIGHYQDGVQFVNPASRIPADHKLWAHKGTSVGTVVFLPAPIGKCDRDLGECKEAWQSEQTRANSFAAENACLRSGKEWRDGECAGRAASVASDQTSGSSSASAMSASDAETLNTIRHCAEIFDPTTGLCVSRAQVRGEGEPNVLAIVGWIAAGLFFLLTCVLGAILAGRFTSAAQGFEEEARSRETEVDRLRAMCDRLQAVVSMVIAKVSPYTRFTVGEESLVALVESLLSELSELRQSKEGLSAQLQVAQDEVTAKQVAIDEADRRNAELSEELRQREETGAAALRSAQDAAQQAHRVFWEEVGAAREDLDLVAQFVTNPRRKEKGRVTAVREAVERLRGLLAAPAT